jgi:serine/threonine protein kinase
MLDNTKSNQNEVINNRYKLVNEIGSGAFGSVYVALDLTLKRNVAVKMLHSEVRKRDGGVERFLSEARVTGALSDPNILTLYDCGEDHLGRLFIVTELLEGESLDELLDRDEKLDGEQIFQLFIPLTKALHHAHEKGVIHRDIKPGNLFLTTVRDEPCLKLLDFGIAKANENIKVTMTGHILGSPAYMSPEQALSEKNITVSTDIYSLGVTLYQCLTGQLPYDAENLLQMLNKVVSASPKKLTDFTNDPKVLIFQSLIDQMLIKNPDKRLASALELSHLLSSLKEESKSDIEREKNDNTVSLYSESNLVVVQNSEENNSIVGGNETTINKSKLYNFEEAFPNIEVKNKKYRGLLWIIFIIVCSTITYFYFNDIKLQKRINFYVSNNQMIQDFFESKPYQIEIVLLPNKKKYQINELVELKLNIYDKHYKLIEQDKLSLYKQQFFTQKQSIKIIGTMAHLLVTGKHTIDGCLELNNNNKKIKPICIKKEIHVADDLLPF